MSVNSNSKTDDQVCCSNGVCAKSVCDQGQCSDGVCSNESCCDQPEQKITTSSCECKKALKKIQSRLSNIEFLLQKLVDESEKNPLEQLLPLMGQSAGKSSTGSSEDNKDSDGSNDSASAAAAAGQDAGDNFDINKLCASFFSSFGGGATDGGNSGSGGNPLMGLNMKELFNAFQGNVTAPVQNAPAAPAADTDASTPSVATSDPKTATVTPVTSSTDINPTSPVSSSTKPSRKAAKKATKKTHL